MASAEHDREPLKLVTIHGTNAGDPDNLFGHRWWQLGSNFQIALAQRLDLSRTGFEVEPFQWGKGANTEAARREAGSSLLKKLRKYDEEGVSYVLLGHSHGGSVIYHSLLQSVREGTPLQGLKQWTTVGTPFLNFGKNRFMFQRLTGISLTIYSTGIASFLIALTYWIFGTSGAWNHVEFAKSQNLAPAIERVAVRMDLQSALYHLSVACFAYSVLCLLTLYILEWRKKKWFTKDQKRQVEDWYVKKWLGLWHVEDEAISALFNVKNVSYSVIPSSFLAPIVGFSNFALVGFVTLSFVLNMIFGDGSEISTFAFEMAIPIFEIDPETGRQNVSTGELHWVGITVGLAAILAMVFALVGLSTWVLKHLARWVGVPFAATFNRVIWKSVRDRAWGDNLPSEDVRSISSHPPEFSKKFDFLPAVVAQPLSSHSDGHAISTLNKVRLLLGMSENAQTVPDLRSELENALNWEELIHTSYFEVPAFIDLLAVHMTREGLVKSKDGYSTSKTERGQLADWLEEQLSF